MLRRLREDPKLVRRLNEWLVLIWLLVIPLVLITGWYDSVRFLTAISIWANLAAHWAAATAARADENNNRR